MTTVAEVRDALAGAINTGTGLRTMAYLSSTIPHPCAHVRLGAYNPQLVLGRAKTEFPFIVTLFLGPVSERAVQLRADQYREPRGDKSIVTAVETSANWSVDVDYASVTLVGEPSEVAINEEILMTVEFEIEVVF